MSSSRNQPAPVIIAKKCSDRVQQTTSPPRAGTPQLCGLLVSALFSRGIK